jgi:lactoylglutathione lyase
MNKLRIALLVLVGTLSGYLLFSEARPVSGAPEFDHATVHVTDLQKSVDFYEMVMELKQIPDPFKDGRHAWFRAGAHEQFHVASGAKEAANHDIEDHVAFRVASMTDFMKRLDQMHVKYRAFAEDKPEATLRPDGVKQVYLQDPDGYWIEVNNDKY